MDKGKAREIPEDRAKTDMEREWKAANGLIDEFDEEACTFDRKEKNVSLCNISGNADVDGKGQIVDIASCDVYPFSFGRETFSNLADF
ncbi:uncharacterized protein OCT59_008702 [Rhizophagus irregularis]|uniref:uncharacterized protein n=1 Tax=Rhizophagus irregularis TaxID=588596 RepID=UPI00332AD392|nr:hypothetical protein OCT59_008702 [Rhizophagus irregularis]